MNYYKVLGLNRTATKKEIKQAYKRLALKYHPDRNPFEKKEECERYFRMISEAYQILYDDSQRNIYDRGGVTHKDILAAKELFTKIFPGISDDLIEIIEELMLDFDSNMPMKQILKRIPYKKLVISQIPSLLNFVKSMVFQIDSTEEKPKTNIFEDWYNNIIEPIEIVNSKNIYEIAKDPKSTVKISVLRWDYEKNQSCFSDIEIYIPNFIEEEIVYLKDNGHEYMPGKFSGLKIINKIENIGRFIMNGRWDLCTTQTVDIKDLIFYNKFQIKHPNGKLLEIQLKEEMFNKPMIRIKNHGLMYHGWLYIRILIRKPVLPHNKYLMLDEIFDSALPKYKKTGEMVDLTDIETVPIIFNDEI